ncbi:MAG TPA: hypothetical protein VF190_11280, partial [Rhodothermales bacterium]
MRSSGRRYWRALLCCLFAGLAPVAVVGQPIQFDIDSAVFAYDAEHSVGEFYLAFDATSLPFRPEGPAFLAEVPLDVRIVRQSDAQLDETPG